MKIIVQRTPFLHAFLLDEHGGVIVSEYGETDLEAIGRLVAKYPEKFHLKEVVAKFRKINLD